MLQKFTAKIGNDAPSGAVAAFAMACCAVLMSGCASSGADEPEVRIRTVEYFSIIPSDKASMRQEKEQVVVEDKGEALDVVAPLQVQDCNGVRLRHTPRELTGYDDSGWPQYKGGDPVYVAVDPLDGLYIRRVKISSNQEHVLRFGRLDAVLADGAGIDHNAISADILEQSIRARFPCASGNSIVASIRGLKVLGNDVRIRPGRSSELLAIFEGVDRTIEGDWTMELLDFPVATNEAGEVVRVTSFQFPLRVKKTVVTIRETKSGFWSPWVEESREIKELE